MILLNNSRLWMQPVRDEEWTLICKMGGLNETFYPDTYPGG
jgi:predicted RNA-binding protein with PUA-like domain